jgi:hypothetical protein
LKFFYASFYVFSSALLSCGIINALSLFNHSFVKDKDDLQIVIPDVASESIAKTGDDLLLDIRKVYAGEVYVVPYTKLDPDQRHIYLATMASNHFPDQSQDIVQKLEARGGFWDRIDDRNIAMIGGDLQGLQYAVYDYAEEVLGIDPLSYWTGYQPSRLKIEDLFDVQDKVIPAPLVPMMFYFENDADELMNLREPLLSYDWESFTEMIDALVRLRYNGIQLFDALGRPEFYLREEYKAIVEDYQIDMDYVEKMIDYIHLKGMAVQIDMGLGYQAKSLESQYADCWKDHKDKWKAVWNYYLKETAFGKADVFSLRPRNQVWDWEYKSACGEDKIEVFNEVYREFGALISEHNPLAKKVVVCYADGMDMFNNGFAPPEDWIVAWSDDGYGGFEYLPESTKGYRFGTYMHAGFWKNHTVAHPYADTVEVKMKMMFDEFGATEYCLVNGQQFRPFIFNLEAYSEVCNDPSTFSGDEFTRAWAQRYFEKGVEEDILQLFKKWDLASFGQAGYVQNLWEIREVIAYLSEKPIIRPGRSPVEPTRERVENDLDNLSKRRLLLEDLLSEAKGIYGKLEEGRIVFFDQILHPILQYTDLVLFEEELHELYRKKLIYDKDGDEEVQREILEGLERANMLLQEIYKNTGIPSADSKWNGWYDPAKRRPNNGFPTVQMMNEIKNAINK